MSVERYVPILALACVVSLNVARTQGTDWNQFRGPNRDGICEEKGLLQEWPEGGPKLLWKMGGLGKGFSSVAIVGNILYTMGDLKAEGQSAAQFVIAVDLSKRKVAWSTKIGAPHSDGPRCTPTVDGELLYAIGTDGDLMCLETKTGAVRWQKKFSTDFGGKMMSGWKFSESPLVDGDKVVCTPGGPEATIVALEKKSGNPVWKCAVPKLGKEGKSGAGYSSIVVAEIEGVRQYVQLLGNGVVGVDAQSGKFLWGYSRVANSTANITSPLVRAPYVLATTSYRTGIALLKIVRSGDGFKAEEVYFHDFNHFANHHGGVVLLGDHVYSGDGQNRGAPTCLELLTGKIAWKEEPVSRGSAAVLLADGRIVFRYDDGVVALVEATPQEFRLKGKFKDAATARGQTAWAHPVIHDGKLYLRTDDVLMCYDVRGK